MGSDQAVAMPLVEEDAREATLSVALDEFTVAVGDLGATHLIWVPSPRRWWKLAAVFCRSWDPARVTMLRCSALCGPHWGSGLFWLCRACRSRLFRGALRLDYVE